MTHINDRIKTVFELMHRADSVCSACKHEEGSLPLSPFQKIQNKSIEELEEAIAACRKAMNGDDDG